MSTLRIRESQTGSTLVEYAFVFVIFMAMVWGIVDFGCLLYAYHFVDHAAKTATRWAAVNGYTCGNDYSCIGTDGMHNGPLGPSNASDVQTYVRSIAPLGINASQVSATATWPAPSGGPEICKTAVAGYPNSPYPNYPGCTVKVQVSYKFNFLVPSDAISFGTYLPPVTLSSTSEMVIAH